MARRGPVRAAPLIKACSGDQRTIAENVMRLACGPEALRIVPLFRGTGVRMPAGGGPDSVRRVCCATERPLALPVRPPTYCTRIVSTADACIRPAKRYQF